MKLRIKWGQRNIQLKTKKTGFGGVGEGVFGGVGEGIFGGVGEGIFGCEGFGCDDPQFGGAFDPQYGGRHDPQYGATDWYNDVGSFGGIVENAPFYGGVGEGIFGHQGHQSSNVCHCGAVHGSNIFHY